MSDDPADVVTASLVRPQGWLDYQRSEAAGRVRLSLPEMGVDGWATVLGVDVCAEVGLLPASGRRVSGVFSHSRGRVVELSLSGEACPLGVTAGHPVWSVDREGWIAAGELLLGERLRAVNGSAVTVLGIAASENDEPVFNLEVDADHCYRVGEQGLLVHNASVTPVKTKADYDSLPQNIKTLITATWNRRVQVRPINRDRGKKPSAANNFAAILVSDGKSDATDVDDANASIAGHAEAYLLAKNVPPGSNVCVVAIFTKRNPCTGCDNEIDKQNAKQAEHIAVYSFGVPWFPKQWYEIRRRVAEGWIALDFYKAPSGS